MQGGIHQQNELITKPSEPLLLMERENKTPHNVLLSIDDVLAAIKEINEDPPRLERLREVLKELTHLSTIATTKASVQLETTLSDKQTIVRYSSFDEWIECNGSETITQLLHILTKKINNVARCKASMLNVTWKLLTLLLNSSQMAFRCYYDGMRYMLECLELQVSSVVNIVHLNNECEVSEKEHKNASMILTVNGQRESKTLTSVNEMTEKSTKANNNSISNVNGAVKLTAFCASHILSVIRASSSRYLCKTNTGDGQHIYSYSDKFGKNDNMTARETEGESCNIAREAKNFCSNNSEVIYQDNKSTTSVMSKKLLKLIVEKYLNILYVIAISPQSAQLEELFSVAMSRFAATYNLLGCCCAEYVVDQETPQRTLSAMVRFTICWSETREQPEQEEEEYEQKSIQRKEDNRDSTNTEFVKPSAHNKSIDNNEELLRRQMIAALGSFHCSLSFIDGCTNKLNDILGQELHLFSSPSTTATTALVANSILGLSCTSSKYPVWREKMLERWQQMYKLTNEFIAVMLHWVPHLSYFSQASVDPLHDMSEANKCTFSSKQTKNKISNITNVYEFIANKDKYNKKEKHENVDNSQILPEDPYNRENINSNNNITTETLNQFSVQNSQPMLELIAEQALLLPHHTFTVSITENANTISNDGLKTTRYSKESSQSLRSEWIALMSKLLLLNRCAHVSICKATHRDFTTICNNDGTWDSNAEKTVNTDKHYHHDDEHTKYKDGLLKYISALCSPSSEHSLLLSDAWVEMIMLIKHNKTPVWFTEQTFLPTRANSLPSDTNAKANVELSLSIIMCLFSISQEVYININNYYNRGKNSNNENDKTYVKRCTEVEQYEYSSEESQVHHNGNKTEAIHDESNECKSKILNNKKEYTADNNNINDQLHVWTAHHHRVFCVWHHRYVAVLNNLAALSFRLLLRQPIFVLINANNTITDNNRSNCNNDNELCHNDYYSNEVTRNNNIKDNKITNVQSQNFVSMFISQLALLSMFANNNNSDDNDDVYMCHSTIKSKVDIEQQLTNKETVCSVVAHHIVEQLHECVNTLSQINLSNKQSYIGAGSSHKDMKNVDVSINNSSNKNKSEHVPCKLSTNTYSTLLHVVTVMLQTLYYLQSMRQLSKVLNYNKKWLYEQHSPSSPSSSVELLECDRLLCERWLAPVSLSVTKIFTSLTRVIVKYEALCRTKMHTNEFKDNNNASYISSNSDNNKLFLSKASNNNSNTKNEEEMQNCTMMQKWLGLLSTCIVSELSAWQLCKPHYKSNSDSNNNTETNTIDLHKTSGNYDNNVVDNEALIACTRRCIDYSFTLLHNTDSDKTRTTSHNKHDKCTSENSNNISDCPKEKTIVYRNRKKNGSKSVDDFNLFSATLNLLKFVENNADVAIEKLHLSDDAASCLMKLLCPLTHNYNDNVNSNGDNNGQNGIVEERFEHEEQEKLEQEKNENQKELGQMSQLFLSIAKWQLLQHYMEWQPSKITQNELKVHDSMLTEALNKEEQNHQEEEEEAKLMLDSTAVSDVMRFRIFHKILLEAIKNKQIANNKNELYWELQRSIRCCAKEMFTVQEVLIKMKKGNLLKEWELEQGPQKFQYELKMEKEKEYVSYEQEELDQFQGQQQMPSTLDKNTTAKSEEANVNEVKNHPAHVFALRSTNLNATNNNKNGSTRTKKCNKRQREADLVSADVEEGNMINQESAYTCNDEWQLDVSTITTELERLIEISSTALMQLREIKEHSFASLQHVQHTQTQQFDR